MFGSLLAAILGEERLREEREAPLPLRITPEDGWELRRCSLGVDWVRTSWGRGALDLQKKKPMKWESRSNYLSLQLLQHSLSEVVLPMVLLVLLLLLEQERRHRRVRVRRSLRPRGVPRRLPGEGTLQHPLLPLKEASHRLFALLLLTRVVIGDAADAAL